MSSATASGLTGEHLRLLRLASEGRLSRSATTGLWYGTYLGHMINVDTEASQLHQRGLIAAGAVRPRTRWLKGELTDTGRAALAAETESEED